MWELRLDLVAERSRREHDARAAGDARGRRREAAVRGMVQRVGQAGVASDIPRDGLVVHPEGPQAAQVTRVAGRCGPHRKDVGRSRVRALQLPDLVTVHREHEELVRTGVLGVAAVQYVAELSRARQQWNVEVRPEHVEAGRPDRVGPARRARRAGPDVQPPEVVEIRAGVVAVIARGAMIVQPGVALRSRAAGVYLRVARLDPGRRNLLRNDALVGSRVLGVAAMDDEVERLRGILQQHVPVRAIAVDAGRPLRARPLCRLGRIDRGAPQVQSPEIVEVAAGRVAIVAVGPVVADRRITLGRGLARVFEAVAALQPDLGIGTRIEGAVGTRAVLRITAMNDEVDRATARRELDPGETAVSVLAEERLRSGPLGDLGRVDAIAPQVQAPEVVEVAGGVITVIAVGTVVVDDRVGRRRSG